MIKWCVRKVSKCTYRRLVRTKQIQYSDYIFFILILKLFYYSIGWPLAEAPLALAWLLPSWRITWLVRWCSKEEPLFWPIRASAALTSLTKWLTRCTSIKLINQWTVNGVRSISVQLGSRFTGFNCFTAYKYKHIFLFGRLLISNAILLLQIWICLSWVLL